MKKGTKITALLILGLVLTSILIGVVSAALNFGEENPIEKIASLLSKSGFSADFIKDVLSPQILFFILIFLILFAVLDQIPLFKNKPGILTAVSIIVAILSAGYIKTDWFLPILNQYTSIGITISFLLPFVLLFYFIKNMVPNNFLIQRIIWGTYTIIVAVNAFINWPEIATRNDNIAKGLYWGVIILSLIMLISGGRIMKYLFKEKLTETIYKREKFDRLLAAGDIARAKRLLLEMDLPPAERIELEKEIAWRERASER